MSNILKIIISWFKCLSFKKIIKWVAVLIIFLASIIVIKNEINNLSSQRVYSYSNNSLAETIKENNQELEEDCNTKGIELHGSVVTYIAPGSHDEDNNLIYDETSSDDVVGAIKEAESNPAIKAIILEVDSYGGYPVPAEEISQALKRVSKPTVAIVRKAAVSSAYWAATGADIIFASALSDIGGIGITASYVDNSKKNIKDGLTFNSLSTGKYKDSMNIDKSLTDDERILIMRDQKIMYDIFVEQVATNRNLDINKVKALADGSSMVGQMAVENKLIDRIGGVEEVREYLKSEIGEDVSVCW